MSAAAPATPASFSFSKFTTLSKALVGVLATGFLVSLIFPDSKTFLALVPGKTFPFVWNIVTSAFLETDVFELLVDAVAVLAIVPVIEPVYGTRSFLLYIFTVSAVSGALTFVMALAIYMTTLKTAGFYMEINGFFGILAAMLVAVKQVFPDRELALFGVFKLKAKWLISLYVALSIPFGLLHDPMKTYPFTIFGWYCAWFYLRFVQFNPETKLRGDPSPDFSFSSFFPGPMRPPVDKLATVCSTVFRLKRTAPAEGQGYVLGGHPLPGSDDADAARRRERGAKALEDRLKKQQASQDIETGEGSS